MNDGSTCSRAVAAKYICTGTSLTRKRCHTAVSNVIMVCRFLAADILRTHEYNIFVHVCRTCASARCYRLWWRVHTKTHVNTPTLDLSLAIRNMLDRHDVLPWTIIRISRDLYEYIGLGMSGDCDRPTRSLQLQLGLAVHRSCRYKSRSRSQSALTVTTVGITLRIDAFPGYVMFSTLRPMRKACSTANFVPVRYACRC